MSKMKQVEIESVKSEVIKEYIIEWMYSNADGYTNVECDAIWKFIEDIKLYSINI